MPERTIAFDLDGTLIDARPRQVAVAEHVVRQLTGAELDGVAFWRRKRRGATTLAALRSAGLGAEAAHAADTDWRRLVEEPVWLELDAPLPGARATLERVRGAGLDVLVLTARHSSDGARSSLRTLDVPELRLDVVSPGAAVEAKAERLRAARAVAFVGDTESDAAAARAAGVPFVAVACGQRTGGFLRAAGCEVVVGSPALAWAALASGLGV